MKENLIALSFYLLAGCSLNAAIIAEEYFNGYGSTTVNVEGLPNGGFGFADAWGKEGGDDDADADYQQGTGLSWGGAGYDNAGNLTGGNDGAAVYSNQAGTSIPARNFTTAATGTVWFSALISIDEVNDRAVLWVDGTDDNSGNSGTFFGVLDGSIHMRYNGTTNLTSAGAPTTGIHLLLGKAELDVSGGNDRLSFWFDPDLSGGEGGLGAATYSDSGADAFGSSIEGVAFLVRDNDSVAAGGEVIDAIRVGTTFDSVTSIPEPRTLTLLGLTGLAGLAAMRRR